MAYPDTFAVVVPCDAKHIGLLPNLLRHFETWALPPTEVVIAASRVRTRQQRDLLSEIQRGSWSFELVLLPVRRRLYEGPNRNRGGKVARSELIIFLDADDFMLTVASQVIVEAFAVSRADMVMYSFSEDEAAEFLPSANGELLLVPSHQIRSWYSEDRQQAGHDQPIPIRVSESDDARAHHGSVAVRRVVLKRVRYGRRRHGADLEFCQKVMKAGFEVVFVHAPLLTWTHVHSTTRGLRVELSRNRARAMRATQRLVRGVSARGSKIRSQPEPEPSSIDDA